MKTESFVEFLPKMLAEEDPPEKFIVPDLLPEGVLVLFHGHPRTMKTLAALEIAIAVATGTPAFGLPKFIAPQTKVWYLTQEDGRRKVKGRLRRMLAGRGLKKVPEDFALSIHKGVDLDKPEEWESKIIAEANRYGFKLIIFDPIRRFSKSSDKGPNEVAIVTAILRRIVEATGATIIVVHHDTKPRENDVRSRSFRASGGDWFAACECPIAFEEVSKGHSLLIPEDYKYSEDPESFSIQYKPETDSQDSPFIMAGNVESARQGVVVKVLDKIVKFLEKNPKASTNKVHKGIGGRFDNVKSGLDALIHKGKVTFEEEGQAKLWSVVKATGNKIRVGSLSKKRGAA